MLVLLQLSALNLIQPLRQFLVAREELAQMDKGSHDRDIYRNGSLTVEHNGEYRDTLLVKGIGQRVAPTPATDV